jgi:hypothetical protein
MAEQASTLQIKTKLVCKAAVAADAVAVVVADAETAIRESNGTEWLLKQSVC